MQLLRRLFRLSAKSISAKKVFRFHSSVAHCVGDSYEYQVPECNNEEEAILKFLAYLILNKVNGTTSKGGGCIVYPNLSRHRTNLPWVIHLGVSGEKMSGKDRKEYDEWLKRARIYSESLKI